MEELIANFSQFKNGWENLIVSMDNMENSKIVLAGFLDKIYPQPDHGANQREITIHTDRTKLIVSRLIKEAIQSDRLESVSSGVVTGWQAYNAIQGYVQHHASRSKKLTMFDRILKASDDDIVKYAERLVLSA